MNRKRPHSILSITAVGLVAISLIAGSSSSYAAPAAKKVVRMGVANGPPFLFQDVAGKWTSFSAELARKFAKDSNMKLVFVPTTWPLMIAGLQANKYDFTQPINANPERRAVVNFTKPLSAAGSLFFVADSSKYQTVADLNVAGVTIAVISGSAEETVAKDLAPLATFRSLTTATVADLASEVSSGRSDAFMDSSYLAPAVDAEFTMRTVPSYATTPNGISPVFISFSLLKSNTALEAKLNKFITKETKSGGIKTLADKWLTVANSLRG